ncbi:MAG: hypothetical protein ABIS69_03815 [Sediminibacterium sp.]
MQLVNLHHSKIITMQKDKQTPTDSEKTDKEEKRKDHPVEKEFDADDEVHETSPDLIQKEDHHLPIDDEVKNG